MMTHPEKKPAIDYEIDQLRGLEGAETEIEVDATGAACCYQWDVTEA